MIVYTTGMVSKSRCEEDLIGEYLDCSAAKLKYIPFDIFETKFDEM